MSSQINEETNITEKESFLPTFLNDRPHLICFEVKKFNQSTITSFAIQIFTSPITM